jgi:hypothetical protein
LQALAQVVRETPELTPRTLPSPIATIMEPAWGPWVTYQLQAWIDGPAWKATPP